MSISVKIDEAADAAYVRFSSESVVRSVQMSDDVVVDLDQHDMVIGVEMLALDAVIPFERLTTDFHVRAELVDLFRRLRPSIRGFMGSVTSGEGATKLASARPVVAA